MEKGNVKGQHKRRYERNRFFIFNLKKEKKCEDCGYCLNTKILVYHHKDRALKRFELNNFGQRAQKTLLEETEKCILLCPNCHAIRHMEKDV